MEHALAPLRLFMVIIGCKPKGRFTEQHDVFFGVAVHIKDLVPKMVDFWPEAKGKIHVDAWREVTKVDGYAITVIPADGITTSATTGSQNLFFINLGGYKQVNLKNTTIKCWPLPRMPRKPYKKPNKRLFLSITALKAPGHILMINIV